MSKQSIVILAPGLCGPLAETESLETINALNSWAACLSRAQVEASSADEYEFFTELLQLEIASDFPTAALTALSNHVYQQGKSYLFADPVHLEADLDHAILGSAADLCITDAETQALCEALNNHFRDDGIRIFPLDNQQWLVESDLPVDMSTTTISNAIGRNVNFLLPEGKGSGTWKHYMTEVQMLMHSHHVNQARENQGLQIINSIWFHGTGVLPGKKTGSSLWLYGAKNYLKGLADHTANGYSPLPENARALMESIRQHDGLSVLVLDELEQLTNYTETGIWCEQLMSLADQWLLPLINSCTQNNIDISVIPCNGKRYNFSKYDRLKFWRGKNIRQHLSTF